jgi:hypothetical protein
MEAVDPPPQWKDMPPGEKQAWLLDQALDRKREILAIPLPDESDDSAEAHRMRLLVLAAADSTINQTIQLRSASKCSGPALPLPTPAPSRDSTRARDVEICAHWRETPRYVKFNHLPIIDISDVRCRRCFGRSLPELVKINPPRCDRRSSRNILGEVRAILCFLLF